jgi:hypothetical protein
MSGSTTAPQAGVGAAIATAQQSIVSNPLLLDLVFILAIFGLLWAWKFMVEGLIE